MDRNALVIMEGTPLSRLAERELSALAAELEEVEFRSGDMLMSEGEHSDHAFVVLAGDIEVTVFRAGRDDENVRTGPGEVVGLLAMIHGAPRSASVRAISDVRAGRLSRPSYERLTMANIGVALALQLTLGAQLAHDVRAVTARVGDVLARRNAQAPEEVYDYDVVVVGSGYLGISYACWVKKHRPQTRIALLDKRSAPGYKLGESSLGPTVRNLVSLGIPMSVLRRLFHVKLELSAWWTGPDSDEVGLRVSPGFFDESFQFERRVLETLMVNQARRLGIDVFEKTLARVRDSDIEGATKELRCDGPNGDQRFRYKLLCDASGPAAVVPRALGLYSRKLESFNTNAYYGYFRKKKDPDVYGWDNSSTRHLCFPEGWVWFIELASWEKTPDDRLRAMIDHLLNLEGPDEDYPNREALAERFGCEVEEMYSIGVVPRGDTDASVKLPVEERFLYYVNKYPGLKRVMDSFEVVEEPYPGHRTYSGYMRMAHGSERFAGNGWLAVGDAAFFVNPLWSPGLAYGSGGTYVAAQDTVAALDNDDFSREAFATYEAHAGKVFKQVFRENDMFYRSFADPVSYERVAMMKFTFAGYAAMSTMLKMLPPGTPPPPVDRPFPERRLPGDPVFAGVTFPAMIDTVSELLEVMRTDERDGVDPAVTGARVKAIIDGKIKEMVGTDAHRLALIHRRMPHYTYELERDESAVRDPLAKIWRCPRCRRGWNQLKHSLCHVCGEPRPEDVTLEN